MRLWFFLIPSISVTLLTPRICRCGRCTTPCVTPLCRLKGRLCCSKAANTFALVENVRAAEVALAKYEPEYRPIHVQVRQLQAEVRRLGLEIEERNQDLTRESRSDSLSETEIKDLEQRIVAHEAEKQTAQDRIPDDWEAARKRYVELATASKKASAILS